MKLPIYMDNHATTAVDPRVLERMLPYFSEHYGNAASRSHGFGWRAEEAVAAARGQVAGAIGAAAREIVFTSGATEANNLALFGVMAAYASKGEHLVTQATEHKAVLDVCAALEKRGCTVTTVPVDAQGRVDPEAVARAMTPRTVLVSIMQVNNEVGTVQPLAEIGAVCRAAGVLLHTDAAQGVGRVPLDVRRLPVDLVSLSAHKIYGPKGVGALFVRRRDPRVSLLPQMHGGGHENGLRSGTLNVPGIVGFGEACRLMAAQGAEETARIRGLRDRLQERIVGGAGDVTLNGHPTERHPGNLHLSFGFVEGEALILALRDVAVSSGSACTSATLAPSYVLRAMGVSEELAHSSIRFGVGRFNTEEEIDYVGGLVLDKLRKLRAMSPRYNRATRDASGVRP
ncbi:MAG TPA: IscS subfamily cysteine desulfurase [Myxococcota bacterium]|nr:IscS subfamily cysteine desulfurase [Myxococcota bacterium]